MSKILVGVVCTAVPGCSKSVRWGTVCPMHAERMRKHASYTIVKKGGNRPKAFSSCAVWDCPDLAESLIWCKPHYLRQWRTGDPLGGLVSKPKGIPEEVRFWTRVDKDGSNPPQETRAYGLGCCWCWTAGTSDKGYGRFWVGGGKKKGGRNVAAHRWAYEHLVGPIPEGMELDHLCRNRLCVNPDHLEVVTRSVNISRKHETSVNAVPALSAKVKRAVAERDGWICQLCYKSVDPNLHYYDPMAKSVDHIVQRSAGGSDEMDNLRLAHRSCNGSRGGVKILLREELSV